jgi:hypothetical protein
MSGEYRVHIDAHRGFGRDALHVVLGRKVDGDRWQVVRELSEDPVLEMVGAGLELPGFLVPAEAARALYDGLGQHFGGTADARQLRLDYDAERVRVDSLLAALIRHVDST